MSIFVNASNNFKRQLVPSVFITFHNQTYSINYPESTNRFCRDIGKRIGNNIRVFVTGTQPEYYMGILGLLEQMNKKTSQSEAFIYCPIEVIPQLLNLKKIMKLRHVYFGYFGLGKQGADRVIYGINKENAYTHRRLFNKNPRLWSEWETLAKELPPNIFQFLEDPTRNFSDDSLVISKELLEQANMRMIRHENVEVLMAPVENNDKTKTHLLMLFVLRGDRLKLDREKVKVMNLTSKDYMSLMTQSHVDLPSGKRILLDDIRVSSSSKGIAFLEIPDESFLDSFETHPFIKWLSKENDEIFELKYIFHLAPAHIVFTPKYLAWLESEPVNKLNHVFIHATLDQEFNQNDVQKTGLRYRMYYVLLSKLFPFFFPRIASTPYNFLENLEKVNCVKTNFISFQQFLVHLDQFRDTRMNENRRMLAKALLNKSIQDDLCYINNKAIINRSNDFKNFPFLITLGTGSSQASTYRNMSSILFAVSENWYGIMDCGEGTYYQLAEQFGDETDTVLCKIRIIMISHLHGDHFLGILLLIQKRAEALKKLVDKSQRPLMFLCLPSNCVSYILTYLDENKDKLDFHLSIIINQEIARMEVPNDPYLTSFFGIEDSETKPYTFLKKFENTMVWAKTVLQKMFPTRLDDFRNFINESEIDRILPVPVIHCPESVGFVIDVKGKRIVYSGDCKMTPELAKYGQNADILIHEATFDCAMDIMDVVGKNHSNIRHALMVAKQMNAKYTCLTHFSQRYRLSSYLDEINEISIPDEKDLVEYFDQRTFLAQDHMYFDLESVHALQSINKLINFYYVFVPQNQTYPN